MNASYRNLLSIIAYWDSGDSSQHVSKDFLTDQDHDSTVYVINDHDHSVLELKLDRWLAWFRFGKYENFYTAIWLAFFSAKLGFKWSSWLVLRMLYINIHCIFGICEQIWGRIWIFKNLEKTCLNSLNFPNFNPKLDILGVSFRG